MTATPSKSQNSDRRDIFNLAVTLGLLAIIFVLWLRPPLAGENAPPEDDAVSVVAAITATDDAHDHETERNRQRRRSRFPLKPRRPQATV